MELNYKYNKTIVTIQSDNVRKEIRRLVKTSEFPECYVCGEIALFDQQIVTDVGDTTSVFITCSTECHDKIKKHRGLLKIGPPCVLCGVAGCTQQCGKCGVHYCCRQHQVYHWKNGHKKICQSII